MDDDQKLPPRYAPAELDGRTLVIIELIGACYEIYASGVLRFIGGIVWLIDPDGVYPIPSTDLQFLDPVLASNRVPSCQGFDYFMIRR